MIQPPSTDCFAAYPATWYLFGPSRALNGRPHSQAMLGRRLVGYRTASGQPVILDAQCPHLGADLGRGRVLGDRLQCPFHGWEYSPDGFCQRVPCQTEVPPFARVRSYPVAEQHGFVFVFNGSEPLFPLPAILSDDSVQLVPGRPFAFVADCTWYILTSNAFDLEHFRFVHDRELVGDPRVDCPGPFARRMNYRARVTGRSIHDRLIRLFLGPEVDVAITSWAGPLVTVAAHFCRASSYMIICVRPLDGNNTLVETIIFAPQLSSPLRFLLQPLSLWLRRIFTQAFLARDTDHLVGIRYSPHSLVHGDAELAGFMDWLIHLPQTPSRARQREVVHSA